MRSPAPRGARGSWLTNEDIPRSVQDFRRLPIANFGIADCRLPIYGSANDEIGNQQSAIGNQQSAIGNRQSAIGNRQSAMLILELAVRHHLTDFETHVEFDFGSELGHKAYVADLRCEEELVVHGP